MEHKAWRSYTPEDHFVNCAFLRLRNYSLVRPPEWEAANGQYAVAPCLEQPCEAFDRLVTVNTNTGQSSETGDIAVKTCAVTGELLKLYR